MRHPLYLGISLVLACSLSAGCGFLDGLKDKTDEDGGTPTSPSPGVSLDVFAGTWNSTTASAPATGCGNLKYTVTPVNSTSANVTFAATCASNIQVNGTGTGAVNGSALGWNAQGIVSQGNVNCPFTFANGRAEQDTTAGTIKIVYTGTVCGIPVSGTEIVKR
jgi:hypothetical protein